MYDLKKPQQLVSIRCDVCGIMAAVQSTTYQTDGRVLIKAVHFSKNGSTTVEHSWYTFEPDRYLVPNIIEVKKGKNPEIVTCPKCHKQGRLNQFHPDIKHRPDLVAHYIKHEYLPGLWGTGKTCRKIKRFNRCYFYSNR